MPYTMELKLSNLDKPSDKKWKKIANYLLFTALPTLNIFFVAIAVSKYVSPEFSLWSVAICNVLIALFKGTTKFTAEPEV